jgi:hypothetical protein
MRQMSIFMRDITLLTFMHMHILKSKKSTSKISDLKR